MTPYLSSKNVAFLLQFGDLLGQHLVLDCPGVYPIVGPGQGLRQTFNGLLELLEVLDPLGRLRPENLLRTFNLFLQPFLDNHHLSLSETP